MNIQDGCGWLQTQADGSSTDDLSVGANYTFSAIVIATLVQSGMSPFAAAPLGILIGVAIGLANGWLTLAFAIPSFIVTLGAMLFWQ